MASIMIYSVFSSMEDSHQRRTTSSLVIMWTEESKVWKPSVSYLLTRLNTPRISLSCEETTSVLQSTESMAFTTNANEDTISNCMCSIVLIFHRWKTFTDCFNCLPIAAIIDEKIFTMHGGLSPDLQSMEQIRRVMRPTDVPDTGTIYYLIEKVSYAISYGLIQTRTLLDGARTIEVSHSPLVRMWSPVSSKSTTWISSVVHIKSSKTDTSSLQRDSSSLCSLRQTIAESLTMLEL